MKKNSSVMTSAGVLIYVLLSLTDRFVVSIPDHVYIPVAVIGAIFVLAGIAVSRRTR